jgi:hypothetical protein
MRLLTLSIVLPVLCVSAVAAENEAVFGSPMFPDAGAFGVVVHTAYRAEGLKSIGVQWVRLNLRWRNIEKGERGNYEWEATDKLLNYYLDHDFHVMAILTMEHLCPLYTDDKENQEVVIDAIADWTGAVAERYKGRGILWEIGNEPECFPMDGYWNQPKTYTTMARRVATAIKQADPHAKTAALSVAWFDRGFIVNSLDAGLLEDGTIDVLTYHGYHRRDVMPESRLAEDVEWLRDQTSASPVILADSERGYAMVDFLEPKHWASWRNITYSESEQAAYCARHYLETIFLGVEIAVWYKDMRGESCYSLYYGTEEDTAGLRPMGHVYRNLAALLPDNPKTMHNHRYTVSLTDPPDTISAPDGQLSVRTYLRTYLREDVHTRQLIIALWNPVEAFDGKILDNRKRIGEHYYEAWRAVSPDDIVEIPTQVRITGCAPGSVESVVPYDLLATSTEAAMGEPLELVTEDGTSLTPELRVGPMPTVLVATIK